MAINTIKIETLSRRVLLVVFVVFVLTAHYYFAKWSFANMASVRAGEPEIAELTTQLAPDDPQTHYAAAVLYDKTFVPEDQQKSLAEYETATALSPNNYLLWLELGKARGRGGDGEGAERALRKALELAPNYSVVQWTLGNALLRQGKPDEGFAEIGKAVASDPSYAAPAVSAAWQIFGGDLERVRVTVGDSARMRAALAALLAQQKHYDEAVEVWNALPADQKRTSLEEAGKTLFGHLIEAKKFRLAQQVAASLSAENQDQYEIGQIEDGGFEKDIKLQNAPVFEWQITDGAQPQIALSDGQKHGGTRSLILVFNSMDGKGLRTISQIVAVEPSKTYTFEASYRSEVKSAGNLKWEIVDASDGKTLAATPPVIAAADWTTLSAKFTVPASSDGIVIRLVLESCGSPICPISGKVWFDDLAIRVQQIDAQ